MNIPGLIDCDVHPAVPNLSSLMPYLADPWPEILTMRGMNELDSATYPTNSPIAARQDWRPEVAASGRVYQQQPEKKAATTLPALTAQLLDAFEPRLAICNCLYGAYLIHGDDLAAAISRAINTWMAKEWLDKEPRLRASIIVPLQNIDFAVEEIEHWASDRRFVQVLLPVMATEPLGKRRYWPIYEAALRHGLAIGIHAGSMYRHPPSVLGWPTYYAEDYFGQAQAFQYALSSLICEGVFDKYPELKVVMLESGFSWLPASLWRLNKYWHGLRFEVPWVKRPPIDIVRDNIRFSLQPVDAPPTPAQLERLMDHLGSDRLLLYSSDYPHWQFDGKDVIPEGISESLARKFGIDNPLETYERLGEVS